MHERSQTWLQSKSTLRNLSLKKIFWTWPKLPFGVFWCYLALTGQPLCIGYLVRFQVCLLNLGRGHNPTGMIHQAAQDLPGWLPYYGPLNHISKTEEVNLSPSRLKLLPPHKNTPSDFLSFPPSTRMFLPGVLLDFQKRSKISFAIVEDKGRCQKKTGKCGNFSQVGDPPPPPPCLGMTCL